MEKTFYPAHLQGTVAAPASKSEAHRRMICAGLTRGDTLLTGFMNSSDMAATNRCLHALGSVVEQNGEELLIHGRREKMASLPVMDCGESGSTLRFFVPIALTVAGGTVFRMHGRLGSRPMDVYRDLFVPRGVRWSMGVGADGAAELTVRGKMEAGDYVLPGNVSSQFVSGLLFALPLLKDNSTLKVEPPVESASYIRMTIEAIRESSIVIEDMGEFAWRIPGNQAYQSKSSHLAGDYSQAAVLCCAGALGHDVTVTHLSPATTQGDRAVLTHLRAMGATVQEDENGIRVTADALHGAVLDMQDCPDIAPILAMTAQFAEGETRLTHCGRLRLKECDRLQATVEILNMLGGYAMADGDDIVITGVKTLRGGVTLPNYGDHRMVMLASIAATRCEAPVTMDGIEAINKSWPTYLDVYQALGGKCE